MKSFKFVSSAALGIPLLFCLTAGHAGETTYSVATSTTIPVPVPLRVNNKSAHPITAGAIVNPGGSTTVNVNPFSIGRGSVIALTPGGPYTIDASAFAVPASTGTPSPNPLPGFCSRTTATLNANNTIRLFVNERPQGQLRCEIIVK